MPVAVHILMRRDGRLLLLRRFQTGYEDGRYSVPAGHLDGGETVIDAAVREAREECGIALVDPVVTGVMHRRAADGERIDFFVTPRTWRGEVRNAEPDKCDDLRFFPHDRLPANMVPYVRAAVDASSTAGRAPWVLMYGWPDGRP